MDNEYKKGAEWRKWDLHVHTPFSIYQHFGNDSVDTWDKYIADLESLPDEFAVIGINDYLFIDGYEKLKYEQQHNNRLNKIRLLPVVEFRIEKFAGIQFEGLKRINLHVIFSDEITDETIKSQFLNTLEQSYSLENGDSWSRAITKESITELGAEIKKSIPETELPNYGSDLSEGFNNLNVKEDQIFASLQKDCFKDKYLIAIGKTEWGELKWTDSSIATKKSIINKADIVFTATASASAFEKAKAKLKEQRVNDLLLDCSDAHYFSDSTDKDRIGNCLTWIKADPTFEGLKQILNEPDDRVFIGEKPLIFNRVANNRTKYISDLKISSIDGYDGKYGKWFEDVSIPLNKELVAIIGHKGSGKSAIADIISLCSNYHNNDDFSFLTSKKFREKSGKIAGNFKANLIWESGYAVPKGLNDIPEATDEKGVKYLPQGQFERLTNEIATASEFQKEIEKVVFSHIDDSENYNSHSFSELIELKKNTLETELAGLYTSIESLNLKIIKIERKNTKVYKTEIEKKLKKKEDELKALAEPPVVSDPNEDPKKKKQSETILTSIEKIKSKIDSFETQRIEKEKEKKEILIALKNLKDTKKEIELKTVEIEQFISEKKDNLSAFRIDFEKLITLKTDFTELDRHISDQENKLEDIKIVLGEKTSEENKQLLSKQIEEQQKELKEEQSKLDSEQKKYQEYLNAKKLWEKEKEKIVGDDNTLETITYYKKEIKYLNDDIEAELNGKYDERRNTARDIFKKKQEVIAIYKDVKSRISDIIKENADNLKNYKVEIEASLVKQTDFNAHFFSYINHRQMGTYYSKEGAEKELLRIISDINFDDEDSVISFLNDLTDSLRHDKRKKQENVERLVNEQVQDVSDLYNYLFKLEFIDFNYQLRQGDKGIEQLSPGERGALLLVFYLLLDKNDIPLIIDQPEDNLDNHSVAKILVPFIRAAKAKRQIIMVTHNPNLAVVSDAEQIIYVNLDKEDNYSFSTVTGSIENKEVNKKIVEVLEGAMPAFNKRKDKYYE